MSNIRFQSPRTLAALIAMTGGALLSSPHAMAATDTSVPLSGTVVSALAVSATATGDASALDLDGEGTSAQHTVLVANITMDTNNDTGLTLTATSGSLSKIGGAAIAYEVTTTDTAGTPVFGTGLHSVATGAAGSATKELHIQYTPATSQDPGEYTGSITLTVSDN